MALNVIKVSRVSAATDSITPIILPLTFFDLLWLKLNPVERVTLYKLTESSRDFFYSVILPKLEQSLSLVLAHFLPLSGHLKWEPQDTKPHIVVSPQDAVSLTMAETDSDFSRVSGKGLRRLTELRALVPELPVSSDSASILTLQITLFPNQGFCIGTALNHAAVDGKTMVKFFKSWAHIYRTVINLPAKLEPHLSLDKAKVITLERPPAKEIEDVVRITLELSQENVKKLRERAKSESSRSDPF